MFTSSPFKKNIDELNKICKPIEKLIPDFINSIKPIIEQYQSLPKIITQSLYPAINSWQKWIEQNKKIFEPLSSYRTEFQQKYNISEQIAVRVLGKYKWFISPSLPKSFVFKVVKLAKKKGRQDKNINKLFIKYFEAKNWRNLETMVNAWKRNPIFKKRHKILQDCVEVVKIVSRKGINETNVVLPTLITQIDGVLTDYLNSKGIKWDRSYNDWIDNKTGKVKKGRISHFKKTTPKVLTNPLDDLATDNFLNILFQKSQPGKPLKMPFKFNRHQIIHGENVKYGRKDYLIRAFMVIDFIAHLK